MGSSPIALTNKYLKIKTLAASLRWGRIAARLRVPTVYPLGKHRPSPRSPRPIKIPARDETIPCRDGGATFTHKRVGDLPHARR